MKQYYWVCYINPYELGNSNMIGSLITETHPVKEFQNKEGLRLINWKEISEEEYYKIKISESCEIL